MSGIGKEPKKGRRGPIPRWRYCDIANGAQVVGWKAGAYVGVETHFHGGTKPCRHDMSDSALSCPMCAAGFPATWRGYCPFYDRDYQRRFVLISEDYREGYADIPLHAPIKLTRGKGSREPVVIRSEVWRTQPLPLTDGRDAEVDLTGFLLRMWRDVELEQWWYSRDMPLSLDPAAPGVNRLDDIARRVDPPTQSRDTRSGADILAAALGGIGDSDDDLPPKPKPSRNGKPHK